MAAPHFHAHFTLDAAASALLTAPDGISLLPRGFKATFIELEGDDARRQTDVMVTTHYAGTLPDAAQAVARAQSDGGRLAEVFQSTPARTKVEFLGDFDVDLTAERYLEAHIKTCASEEGYPQMLEKLRQLAPVHGFRLSSNPRERRNGQVRHFANLRIRDGSATAGRARVAEVQRLLRDAGITLERSHVELNVWDSNSPLDRWWA